MEKFLGDSGPGFTFYYNGGGRWEIVVIGGGAGLDVVGVTPGVTAGSWNHVAARRSGTEFQILVNGVLLGSRTSSIAIGAVTRPLAIGRRNNSSTFGQLPLNGKIDDVAIWNRALSDDEINYLKSGHPVSDTLPPPDKTPPSVQIKSPMNGHCLPQTTVSVVVDVQDESATTVKVMPGGDTKALPPGGGTVILNAGPLLIGPNAVTVEVTDTAGFATHASVQVIHDPSPPEIAFLYPSPGATFASHHVPVRLDIKDDTETWVLLAGQEFHLPAGRGVVSATFEAPGEGSHTVIAQVRDCAGNESQASVTIRVDTTVPLVSIHIPPGPFNGASNPILFTVTVDDATETTVASNPSIVTDGLPPGGGVLSGTWTLHEGLNHLQVTATDSAGGIGSAEVIAILDTQQPLLTLAFPQGGECVRGVVQISAGISDPPPGTGVAFATVEVDPIGGMEMQQGDGTEFIAEMDTTQLLDGPAILRITAADGVRNLASREIAVHVDNTPPEVSLLEPASGALVGSRFRVLASAVDLGCGIVRSRILFDGTEVATFGAEASLEVCIDTSAATGGLHTIDVESVDGAGNPARTSIQVEVDNSAPAISILTPAPGSVVRGAVSVSALITDVHFASAELRIDGVPQGILASSTPTWTFDSAQVLDGACMIEVTSTDTVGNSATAQVEVTVDNASFVLTPTTLQLKAKAGEGPMTGKVEGASAGLLIPTESALVRLMLPNGASVQSQAGFGGDDAVTDGVLVLKFDRAALVAAVNSGISEGSINPREPLFVNLLVGVQGKVIGSDYLNLKQ